MSLAMNRLELVRVTEAGALTAARWMGLGRPDDADAATTKAMLEALEVLDINGRIVMSEAKRLGSTVLEPDQRVGTGHGPEVDVIMDSIDGRNLVASAQPGALSVLVVAPRGSLWAPDPAVYMDKIVVDGTVGEALVTECLDAPAAWTLALIARVKRRKVSDLIVFILDRPRHQDLIAEVREAGARVLLQAEGDIGGAIWAARRDVNVDVLMGVGGVTEGILAAAAVKVLGGSMLGRLAPLSSVELEAVQEAGHNVERILSCHDLVGAKEITFVATGITGGKLLQGVRFHGDWVESDTMVLSGDTSRQRMIHTEHLVLPDV